MMFSHSRDKWDILLDLKGFRVQCATDQHSEVLLRVEGSVLSPPADEHPQLWNHDSIHELAAVPQNAQNMWAKPQA